MNTLLRIYLVAQNVDNRYNKQLKYYIHTHFVY